MISQNIDTVKRNIETVVKNCNRQAGSVKLIAVSKRFSADAILKAQQAGQELFGENYLQEAIKKYEFLGGKVKFHFIGHLQSNKAKNASRIFSMIETVSSRKLAKSLNKHLLEFEKQLDILVQVNIGKDEKKSGVYPEHTEELLRDINNLSNIRIRGLMTITPYSSNPEDSRVYFKNMFLLSEEMKSKQLFYDNNKVELSMGMSNDYHIAIEEGATSVRVGTAIFGERPPK